MSLQQFLLFSPGAWLRCLQVTPASPFASLGRHWPARGVAARRRKGALPRGGRETRGALGPKLGSGNDFEVFFQRLGIASGRARYTKNWKVDKFSSYPVYHSVYETYEIVKRFYDPTFKNHQAVAQVRGGMVFELADSLVLPFDCRDYAEALKSYARVIYNMTQKYPTEVTAYGISLDPLLSAVTNFSEAAIDFHRRLQQLDTRNLLAVRSRNDQLMFLERAFIDPLGLPGTPFYRHIIFAPNRHNKYAGVSFPGIYDALFDIGSQADQRKAWEEVKRQVSIAAYTVQAAAGTLREPS